MSRLLELLSQPVLEVAPRLLGMIVRTVFADGEVAVTLNEVEAYAGEQDPASHAYRGRTKRNGAMFGPAGTLYVYRAYGLHWCMNVVTGDEGVPHAVLLRGGVVVVGEEVARERRARIDHLADGPGKLTQALAVTGEHDGTSLLTGPVQLAEAPAEPHPSEIRATPRIGISKAVDRPWRFLLRRGGETRH